MDDRIVKRDSNGTRNSRGDTRPTTEDVMVTSQERRRMFKEFAMERLPNPPVTPGWHYIWLSTTSQHDPIYRRMQMGYVPVKADELPGFNHYRLNSGEFEGCVSINEMILFKLPDEIYQEIMQVYHHELPMEEEERIRANAVDSIRDSTGKNLGGVDRDDEGFRNIVSKAPIPVFN